MSDDWTQITIFVPPRSDLAQKVTDLLKDEQFHFSLDIIAYERLDGAVAEFSPCPPLAR